MESEIVFYALNAKVLERASDVPDKARQVVYYSLAIGHHIGVFDCFKPLMRCHQAFYDGLIAKLPTGEARRKLEGLNRFSEIIVDRTHTKMLSTALADIRAGLDADEGAWVDTLSASLQAIEAEPAIYLMGRKRS